MFTGIVEEVGTIGRIQEGAHSAVLHIRAGIVTEGTRIGDSIAVNGICLTVTSCTKTGFSADVMHETLNRSALSALSAGSPVNLERAMPANGRFGGHIVSGHVDGVGVITQIRRDDTAVWYTVKADPGLLRYVVEKGSIAIDGISLTVAAVTDTTFSISAIPHTVKVTALCKKKTGDPVNLETDVIGKYVERLLASAWSGAQTCAQTGTRQPGSCSAAERTGTVTAELLERYGF